MYGASSARSAGWTTYLGAEDPGLEFSYGVTLSVCGWPKRSNRSTSERSSSVLDRPSTRFDGVKSSYYINKPHEVTLENGKD